MQILLTAPQECFGERRIGIHGAVEIGFGKGAKLAFGQSNDIMLGKRSKQLADDAGWVNQCQDLFIAIHIGCRNFQGTAYQRGTRGIVVSGRKQGLPAFERACSPGSGRDCTLCLV